MKKEVKKEVKEEVKEEVIDQETNIKRVMFTLQK